MSTDKSVNVVRICRADKPSSTEGNKNIKYPIQNVDISPRPSTKLSNVSVIKLSKSKSVESNVRVSLVSQSSNIVRQSLISNDEPCGTSKQNHSVNVSRVKRLSDNTRKPSIINVVKRLKSISQVSTVQSAGHGSVITAIKSPKISFSARNEKVEIGNKLTRNDSNVIVTKPPRLKSTITN